MPDGRDAAALGREGVSRGRVWTTGELDALRVMPDRTPYVVRTVAMAKHAIDGDIVEVRQQREIRASGDQLKVTVRKPGIRDRPIGEAVSERVAAVR